MRMECRSIHDEKKREGRQIRNTQDLLRIFVSVGK